MSSLLTRPSPSRLFILIIILVSGLLVLTASNIDQQRALAMIRPDPATYNAEEKPLAAKVWDFLPMEKERWEVDVPLEKPRPDFEEEMRRPALEEPEPPVLDEETTQTTIEDEDMATDEEILPLEEEILTEEEAIEPEAEAKAQEPEFDEDFLNPVAEAEASEPVRESYPEFTIDPRRPTLVTATDETHFCQLTNLLANLHSNSLSLPESKKPQIIFYDIGLTSEQRSYIHRLVRSHPDYLTGARDFNWDAYPEFWRMTESDGTPRPEHGQYAWKAGATYEIWLEVLALREQEGLQDLQVPVVWIDSGTYVDPSKPDAFQILGRQAVKDGGFFAARSGLKGPNMAKYLHQGTLDYYGLSLDSIVPSSPQLTLSEIDCAATVIAFVPFHGATPIIEGWLDCAMNETCIAPEGSDRVNSRQDQSALTILSASLQRDREGGNGRKWYNSCHWSNKVLRDQAGVSFHRFDYVCRMNKHNKTFQRNLLRRMPPVLSAEPEQ